MKTYITVELEGGEGVQGQTIAFVASLKGSGAVITEASISEGEWRCEEVSQQE